ncbi:MAG: helix-turn-helix domain-containing protein [Methanoculleus sp.]|nr:helix-turn-helix domain-containing protein [Methanoculleus sp.]
MLRGYRYRLYPTNEQEVLIARHPGCCRFVYNWALDLKNRAYQDEGVSLPEYSRCRSAAPVVSRPWGVRFINPIWIR